MTKSLLYITGCALLNTELSGKEYIYPALTVGSCSSSCIPDPNCDAWGFEEWYTEEGHYKSNCHFYTGKVTLAYSNHGFLSGYKGCIYNN